MISPASSPLSSHARTLPVLGLVCVLALSACSAAEENDSGPAPSAISPDALVTCEDNGDCGEPGSVRWSLPLEDGYQISRSREEASTITPTSRWLDPGAPVPGAVVDDGVLFHYRESLVTAIDTADGTELWTEELDHPVTSVRTVGGTLVVRTFQPGEEENRRIQLLISERDGARPLETDLPEDLLLAGSVVANDTHLAVWEDLVQLDRDADSRFFLVDASTGEVERTHSARAVLLGDNLADDNTLYLRPLSPESNDDPTRIVGIADGSEVVEFDLPEEVGPSSYRLWATGTGEVLFNNGHCTLGESDCRNRRITAVDADSGQTLWSEERAGAIVSLTEDGSTTRLHVNAGNDYRTLDARTGEVLAEGEEAAEETEALIRAFGSRHPHPRAALPSELRSAVDEEALGEEEAEEVAARLAQALDMVPAELRGPGVDEITLDGLAAGIRHLTSYLSEDGDAVGVFLGCAPGEVRTPSWDAASPEAVCAEPRLFAVDYGV